MMSLFLGKLVKFTNADWAVSTSEPIIGRLFIDHIINLNICFLELSEEFPKRIRVNHGKRPIGVLLVSRRAIIDMHSKSICEPCYEQMEYRCKPTNAKYGWIALHKNTSFKYTDASWNKLIFSSTRKALSKLVADDVLFIFSLIHKRKRLVIPCESSAGDSHKTSSNFSCNTPPPPTHNVDCRIKG